MAKFLTKLGKEIIRKLYYDVETKKYQLINDREDIGGYNFQAIQQREIAVLNLFDALLTDSSLTTGDGDIADKDVASYYESAARDNVELKFKQDAGNNWQDCLTEEGLHKALELYKEDLRQKQASWHDGDFTYLPNLTDIGDMNHCVVNYNYLERQQGYRVALAKFRVPKDMVRNADEEISDHVYARKYKDNGTITYVRVD